MGLAAIIDNPVKPDFEKFPSIPRIDREIIITEKIDGTNAQIVVNDLCDQVWAGSRKRFVTPGKGNDNFGFAAWVYEHAAELLGLGPGRHYGEWWGPGIQRGYGVAEKRFSLFNTHRWGPNGKDGPPPACCHVVPVLAVGPFSMGLIDFSLHELEHGGSVASPGFMRPEGVVVFHSAANSLFKMTLNGDGHKSADDARN